jgi:hypothetical protein
MAWLIGDSFDFYNGTADVTKPGTIWASASGLGAFAGGRFGVGQSLTLTNNTLSTATSGFTNSTTIWVNFSLAPVSNLGGSASTPWAGFILYDAATIQFVFQIMGDGSFTQSSAWAGTVYTQSGAGLFPSSNTLWTHLQVKIVIDPTVGSIEVRLNGSTTAAWNPTGLNTRRGTSNSYCNGLVLQTSATGGYFDDFYAFNDQGSSPTTWQGDVRAVQLMPTSDSSVTWTPNSGGNNYSRVSEAHEDGDTSYVSTNTINNVDLYGITALSTTPNAIVNVAVKSFVRMDDAGPHTYKNRLSSSGTASDGSNLALSSGYQWSWTNYPTDPHTSAAWTATAVNAALIGPFDVA